MVTPDPHSPSVDCVLLAAGESIRMGSWKMLLPFGGTTIIGTCLSAALEVCRRVIVVTGFRGEELEERVLGTDPRVLAVRNDRWRDGMFASIRRGVREVGTADYFIALGDMPRVDAALYRDLLVCRRLIEADDIDAAVPTYRGKKGHPVLLGSRARELILAADEAVTLRDVMARLRTLLLPVDRAAVLQDIDLPQEYEMLRNADEPDPGTPDRSVPG